MCDCGARSRLPDTHADRGQPNQRYSKGWPLDVSFLDVCTRRESCIDATHRFAELVGTMVVGCMPMFPRFYEHLSSLQGPFSSLSSLKSFLSSRKRSSRDTSKFSRVSQPGDSTHQIVVTSDSAREDIHWDPNHIELRDGQYVYPKWGAENVV